MDTLRRLVWRRGNNGGLALLALLALSLLALAYLQHRFTLQASQADEQRLRTLLEERVRGFARDVDGPLSQIALRFWIDPEWLERQPDRRAATLGEIDAAWQDWSATPLAALVRHVLVVEVEEEQPRLWRFDPARRALAAAGWTEDLQPFRSFLLRQRRGEADWLDAAGPGPTTPTAYGVLPAVPALVFGRSSERERALLRLRHSGAAAPEHAPVPLGACSIVVLDADFVARRFIPALVERYFPADEYDVVLRAGGSAARVLFARAPAGVERVLDSADVRAPLLKLDVGELGGFVEHGHAAQGREPRRHSGELSAPGSRPRPLRALLQRSALEDPERVTRLVQVLAERGWQLHVKHRTGSLAAAAAAIRLRNLLLGYGALLLLAASLALVLSSALAARRLARQQIEFVAGVSHELRTPIAVVRAMSTNMADGLVRSDEQVAAYGRHLQQHSRRLGDLVERTLEYAGIASGRRRCEATSVGVAEIVRQAAAACDPVESSSRVDLELAPDLPSVPGDPVALASAVRNLIENGLRYSPCDQRVTVEVGGHAKQVVIAVVDRGGGVDPEDLPHLFEPFYRGRAALRDGKRGVGLGLALTREIMEAHGGRVEVQPEPGGGSRFCLILPAGEAP